MLGRCLSSNATELKEDRREAEREREGEKGRGREGRKEREKKEGSEAEREGGGLSPGKDLSGQV